MRPLVAHCHLGLGKLYRRTGKREEADEHLTTATTMYREMDMLLCGAGGGGDVFRQADSGSDGWPVNGRTAGIDRRKSSGRETMADDSARRHRAMVGAIAARNMGRSPTSADHAERRWQHHAAAIGEVNCPTPPRRSGGRSRTQCCCGRTRLSSERFSVRPPHDCPSSALVPPSFLRGRCDNRAPASSLDSWYPASSTVPTKAER